MAVELGLHLPGFLRSSMKAELKLQDQSPPKHPNQFRTHIAGSISTILSKILDNVDVSPQGTGVISIFETRDGNVKVNYSCRVIEVPPELYLHDPLRIKSSL